MNWTGKKSSSPARAASSAAISPSGWRTSARSPRSRPLQLPRRAAGSTDSACEGDRDRSGDISDAESVTRHRGVDVVFHLAALIGIPYSYEAPLSYVRTNVEGTLNVLQRARRTGSNASSTPPPARSMARARQVPIDRGHPLHGQSPYSASKIGADKLADAFHCSFGAAGRHGAPVQHLRSAPIGARGDSDDHHAGADAGAGDSARQPAPDARPHVRRRHVRRVRAGRASPRPRSARSSNSAPGAMSRSATSSRRC